MKKSQLKRAMSLVISLLFILVLFACDAAAFDTEGLEAGTSVDRALTSNSVGTHNGYTYEYWKDYGSGSMTLNSGATFYVDWSNIGNLLARIGVRPGSKDQTVTYGVNYQPNGNSYMCVYGWARNPLVEYYIVDSWGSWRPPGEGYKGSVNIDGATYDIYETIRYNKPSIDGDTTFHQYWSVRQNKRTSGTINVGKHFAAWQSYGMNLGDLYEVSFCIEGYQSSGYADVYSLSFGTGSSSGDDGSYTPPPSNDTGDNTVGGQNRLKNMWSGMYLSVEGDGNNANVAAQSLNTSWTSQQWVLEDNYRIRNVWSGKYLAVTGNEDYSNVVCQDLNTSWGSQQWTQSNNGDANRFTNNWSGKVLAVTGNNDGANVQAQPLNTSWSSQQWSME